MSATTNFGWTKPDATTNVRIWEWVGTFLDQIDTSLKTVATIDACLASRAASQSIPNNTMTAVSLDTQVKDTNGMFAPTSTDITIKTAGLYHICVGGTFALNGTGERLITAFVNGAEVTGIGCTSPASAANTIRVNANNDMQLAVNDIVTMRVFQTSGGALNFTGTLGVHFIET